MSLCQAEICIVKALDSLVVIFRCKRWTIKKVERWRIDGFWTVVLEKTLESPLDCKIKLVNHKGNPPWIFIGRTVAKAEAPILWPPDGKSWLTGKDPDPGKDWRQEEKATTEDEMVGWHHRLSGRELEQSPGDGEGRRSLACCSPRVTESDAPQWLNNDKVKFAGDFDHSLKWEPEGQEEKIDAQDLSPNPWWIRRKCVEVSITHHHDINWGREGSLDGSILQNRRKIFCKKTACLVKKKKKKSCFVHSLNNYFWIHTESHYVSVSDCVSKSIFELKWNE